MTERRDLFIQGNAFGADIEAVRNLETCNNCNIKSTENTQHGREENCLVSTKSLLINTSSRELRNENTCRLQNIVMLRVITEH